MVNNFSVLTGKALLLLLVAFVFHTAYDDGYYVLAMLLLFFFVLPKMSTCVTRNIRTLQAYIWLFVEVGADYTILSRKIKVCRCNIAVLHNKAFKLLRVLVFSYTGSALFLVCFKIFMIWDYSWVMHAATQLIFLVMGAALCIILRPAKNGNFSCS